ncbi:MAG: hypothetical protein JWP61_2802 [Friedmanniella sp.]|nr:hypothetical protein [Friedmanniella sp.]
MTTIPVSLPAPPAHPELVAALAAVGCRFDVAGPGEVPVALGAGSTRPAALLQPGEATRGRGGRGGSGRAEVRDPRGRGARVCAARPPAPFPGLKPGPPSSGEDSVWSTEPDPRQNSSGGAGEGTSRSISRILSTAVRRPGDHPSATAVASGLVRPTRKLGRAALERFRRRAYASFWSCSGWGLPSRPSHLGRWWSLTPPFHPYLRREPEAVSSLWHCPAGHPGWALPTTVLCGVRTFLDRCCQRPRPPDRLVRRPAYRSAVRPRASCSAPPAPGRLRPRPSG